MKKMFFLTAMAMLITGSVFWGCNKEEVLELFENEEVMLKSAAIGAENECLPVSYSLVTQKNWEVGQIIVSNDEYDLTVIFTGNELAVSELQLWVGKKALKVPMNRQGIPVPGKFPWKASDYTTFQIPLSGLFKLLPGESYDGKNVYIFAHVEFEESEINSNDSMSAWSEGMPFGTKRWGSYSVYTVCARQKGCSPHKALGGNTLDEGVYYYDNTSIGGGSQNIYADNEKVAGTVRYNSGTISFSFNQEWMFPALLPSAPSVVVYGYTDLPGVEPDLVFEGEPTFNQELITVDVAFYNYYKIELNLQECY
ncbi:MAG: hypothetical protein K0B11_19140 [Mariniphaga sp.]|nr:hypothetical protein [Mariniphaga sp.]